MVFDLLISPPRIACIDSCPATLMFSGRDLGLIRFFCCDHRPSRSWSIKYRCRKVQYSSCLSIDYFKHYNWTHTSSVSEREKNIACKALCNRDRSKRSSTPLVLRALEREACPQLPLSVHRCWYKPLRHWKQRLQLSGLPLRWCGSGILNHILSKREHQNKKIFQANLLTFCIWDRWLVW